MLWTTTIRIPLARDLSLSSPRPKLEKMENARTKGLLVPRSNGTDIEHWVSATAVGPFKIATGTQGRLGTLIVALSIELAPQFHRTVLQWIPTTFVTGLSQPRGLRAVLSPAARTSLNSLSTTPGEGLITFSLLLVVLE